jgi:hypothetical protein
MLINGSDPIDADSVNDLYKKVEKIKDSLISLVWRNSEGDSDKTIRSLDEKKIQITAGTVPVKDKTAKDDEVSIEVKFHKAFGGRKSPTVVAMPDSPSPYGVSVKRVTKDGFMLVIHQFPDNKKDDKMNLSSIHYIAIGMP